jgi:hypothetical protein
MHYKSLLFISTIYNVGKPIRFDMMIRNDGFSGEQKVRGAVGEGQWRFQGVHVFSTKIGLFSCVPEELS